MITFNKFGLLSSKLTSNVKQFWLNKSLFGRTLLLSMLMFGVSQPVLATVTNYQSSDFKCDTLYAATPGYIYSVNLTNAQGSLMYRVTNSSTATIALGAIGGRDSGNPLNMYSWDYSGGNSRIIHAVTKGDDYDWLLGTFTNSGSWAGGEVNQVTGQLYITGAYNANIQNNYEMALVTPKINSGTASIDSVTLSGRLVPLPGQTAITGEVSSDMAIDAEGNAYMIVGRQSTRQLIRVQPPKMGSSSWYYNVVADLSGFNTEQIWGMAFLNGRLYTSHSGGSLYEVDVLSGSATRIGSINSSTSGTVRDLASCQVAPVIKGKIYNDKTGSATNISSLDGVENIDVELWKGNKWYKTFTTNATGEYSFIVDSTDGDNFYIRIKQPKINGLNAVQTWASSNTSVRNPVAATCQLANGTVTELSSDGVCRGASLFAPDPIGTAIEKGYIYTKVTMNSDAEVAEASFALTTVSNFGDAPSSYNHATLPAAHIAPGSSGPNEQLNWLRLGDAVSTQSGPQANVDANQIASHDGVTVALKDSGNFVSLQDALLVSGKTYTFKVKTMGPAGDNGYLNSWIDWTGTGSGDSNRVNSFSTRLDLIADRQGISDGYVTFDYEVPSGSATGLHHTYARFRFSSTQGLGPNNNSLPTPSATVPWAVDGEVEDYRVYITTGDIQLSTISKGGTGTFSYTLSNVSNTSPSANTDSLTTTAVDTKVQSNKLHAFSAVGNSVTITQALPNTDWEVIGAECKDGSTTVNTTLANGVLTIPASEVKEGASISCTFTNGVTPKIELEKVISGSRFKPADQFTIKVNGGATDESVTTSGTATTATTTPIKVESDKVHTLSEIMAAGSASTLNRYETEINCINGYNLSSTTVPSGKGQSFNLTPFYGDDIKCTLTNTSIVADITNSSIKANPISITADGNTESTITVQLKDANNNLITDGGDTVEVFFTDTTNKKGQINKTTNNSVTATGDGTYTVKVTSTQAGSDTFSYSVNGTNAAADKTATVSYTAGKADITKSEIDADPRSIVADDNTLSTITVQLKDGNGNNLTSSVDPVTGKDYVVKLVIEDPKLGTYSPSEVMTPKGDGTFVAYVKSTTAGTDTIGFTIDGIKGTDTTTVTYTVGEPNIDSSDIDVSKTSIVADGVEYSTITVTLKDKYGNQLTSGNNPATGAPYDIVIVAKNSPDNKGILTTTQNNNDGTFTATVTSEKTGQDTFGFMFGLALSAKGVDVAYTPGEVDLTKSTIDADPKSITADGNAVSTVTVQLKDKFNNNLTSQAGEVKITGVTVATEGQGVSAISASYVGDGRYEIKLHSTKTGVDGNIGFTLNTLEATDKTSVTYTPGEADLTQSTISLSKDSIVADNTDSSLVTIQLKDSNGNNLTSSAGVVTLWFNGSSTTPDKGIIAVDITDNLDGTYTATMKSQTSGSDVIGFKLDSTVSTNTKTLAYTAGEVDFTQSDIKAEPSTIEANGTDESTITVQLKDKFGNEILTNQGTVTITSDNSLGTVKGGNTLNFDSATGKYKGVVVSSNTGTDTFTYQISGKGTGSKTASVTYKTGGVSLTQSTITASLTTITADDNMESLITVQLKDSNGHNITTQEGNVYFVDLNTGHPSNDNVQLTYIADGRYEAKIKSKKAGFDNISYKLGTDESSASKGSNFVTVTYEAGEVDFTKSTIKAEPNSITANDLAKSYITVQLMDKYENKITTDQGKVILTGLVIGKPNNPDYSLTFRADGTYNGTITSTQTGVDNNISFTLDGKGNGDKSVAVTYTAGPVDLSKSTISASKNSIAADYTDVSTISIQFNDAFGNPISNDVTGTILLTGLVKGEQKTSIVSKGNGLY